MSTTKLKKLPMAVLEEAARVATQIALSSYPALPESLRVNLTLGTFWDGDSVVFELYLPQERAAGAIVLTEARLNMYDGRVQVVRVFKDAFMAAVASASN